MQDRFVDAAAVGRVNGGRCDALASLAVLNMVPVLQVLWVADCPALLSVAVLS